jgi:acyl-CoA thioester hydrolase
VIATVRVIFGDTDQMGVVYYANYLRYFEGARADYWRALGKSYKDLEAANIALPVVEAHCAYKRPARYEDLLAIDIRVAEMRSASLRFSYAITRDSELIVEGWTRHAAIGLDGRPRAIPPVLRDPIAAAIAATASPTTTG